MAANIVRTWELDLIINPRNFPKTRNTKMIKKQ